MCVRLCVCVSVCKVIKYMRADKRACTFCVFVCEYVCVFGFVGVCVNVSLLK